MQNRRKIQKSLREIIQSLGIIHFKYIAAYEIYMFVILGKLRADTLQSYIMT
jgi:hypothetical protein